MVLLGFHLLIPPCSAMSDPEVNETKVRIVALAESFKGQGDPDRTKQRQLEALVRELTAARPPAPLPERIKLIVGAWEQVWGPYDYSSSRRRVDPSIDPNHIYQVVFEDGYYYNVNPTVAKSGAKPERVGILRGVYELDPSHPELLNVRFTKFTQVPGFAGRAEDYIALPKKSENRSLPDERRLVPTWIVRTFFGKGTLREVYTDADLRITFGSGRAKPDDNYIYILRRVDRTR
jgi:hypothetical protein